MFKVTKVLNLMLVVTSSRSSTLNSRRLRAIKIFGKGFTASFSMTDRGFGSWDPIRAYELVQITVLFSCVNTNHRDGQKGAISSTTDLHNYMSFMFFSLVGLCYDLCSEHVPCQNGGSCLEEEDGLNRCYCTSEWTGPHCNTPLGEKGEDCYKEGKW